MRRLVFFLALLPLLALPAASCSHGSSAPIPPLPDVDDEHCVLRDDASSVQAACSITIEPPALLGAVHVPIGTVVDYGACNPPSSGPHYPIWAAYRAYTAPIDRRYWVHDLEHGAVVFLYRCDDAAGCPDVAAALQRAADTIPSDPRCNAEAGVRVRAVITPDPLLDVPVAAAAWGWIYRAECVDEPSLQAFTQAHYGQGPENICTDGVAFP